MKRPVIAIVFALALLLGLIWATNLSLSARGRSGVQNPEGEAAASVANGEMEGVEFQSRDEASGIFTRVSAKKLSLSEGRAFLFFRSALKPEVLLKDPRVTLASDRAQGTFSATGRLGIYDPSTRVTRLGGGVRGDADGAVFVAVELTLTSDGSMSIEGAYTVEGPKGKYYRGEALKLGALRAGAVLKDMVAKGYLRETGAPAVAPVTSLSSQETVNNP